MPYYITQTNPDCPNWAVEKEDGELIGCHDSKESAIDQAVAISIDEDTEFVGERAAVGSLAIDDYVSWSPLDPRVAAQVVMVEGQFAVVRLFEYEDGIFSPTDKMMVINVFQLEKIPTPKMIAYEIEEIDKPMDEPIDDSIDDSNAEVTVVNSTTFTYFSPGEQVSTTADTNGRMSLAGNTVPRNYVYTWFTPWEEESIASEPSDNLYIKEGQTVTVTNLPTAKPTGENFVRGVRLYRTLASASGTEYFRLGTLWFPTGTARVSRTDNVSRVTLNNHHNLGFDDRFKLSGCTDTSFNITGGIVTNLIDDYTFEYAQTASNVADKAETAGTVYHDVAETLDNPARYWGDGSYSFTDDFDARNLFDILETNEYDPPPSNLRGIIAAQNNILVGFDGNQLYFSEPNVPHAWPAKYALTFEYDIVGIASVGGYILVLTEEYPYQVSGNNPATMAYARIDTLYPCLSKRSIVNMGYGVAYVTYGGLAVYNPAGGMDLITKFVHDWDTWPEAVDLTNVTGRFYNGKYFGSDGTASFIFERDDRIGGFFVQINYKFTAAWYDPRSNDFYYIADNLGNLYEWDKTTQPLSAGEWKSKTIVTKDFLNLGAARIVADYATPDAETEAIAAYNAGVPAYNLSAWNDYNTTAVSVSYARTSNVATIVTVAAHKLVTGSRVSITGFISGEVQHSTIPQLSLL